MLQLLLVRQRTHRGTLTIRRQGLSHAETQSVRSGMHFVVSLGVPPSWSAALCGVIRDATKAGNRPQRVRRLEHGVGKDKVTDFVAP